MNVYQNLIDYLGNIFKQGVYDWKTSIIGIVILLVAAGYIAGMITDGQLLLIVTLLNGIGFTVSRDSKKVADAKADATETQGS